MRPRFVHRGAGLSRYDALMQLRWAAFGVLLASSGVLNVYLLMSGEPAAQAHAGRHAIPVVHRVNHEPPPLSRADVVVPAEIAALDDHALESRLAEAEKKLDKALPLPEKFELGERAPALEDRVRPMLDEAFTTDDGSVAPYDLECRDDICRIDNVGLEGWRNLVSPAIGMHQDRLVMGESVWVKIVDESLALARRATELMLFELKASKDARACITPDAHHGVVTIKFVLDPATRRIHAVAGGALADDVVGVCIRNAAEAIASKATVPASVTALPDWPYPYEVP